MSGERGFVALIWGGRTGWGSLSSLGGLGDGREAIGKPVGPSGPTGTYFSSVWLREGGSSEGNIPAAVRGKQQLFIGAGLL